MNQLFSTSAKSKTSSQNASISEDIKKRNLEELVFRYGNDSLAYLTLEGEKQYYIGKNINGFIAYVIINNTAICVGNPVCMSSKSLYIVNEFKAYCTQLKYKLCFCSISEEFASLLNKNGYIISKYGEEALLDLDSYIISGGKTEKLRQKLRRAEKSGIRIVEYFPSLERDLALEEKIQGLTQDWFSRKNGQLTFTLGDLNFNNPLHRRFFIALDEANEVEAIIMFSPFNGKKGYFLDVMRRKSSSVPGVMEKAIIDATMKIKSEGVRWISLGLAPLAGIQIQKDSSTYLEKLFNLVFHHGNSGYKFQSLYQYKKKFNPSCWNSRYVAHEKGLSTLKVAYVMAKARNVEGVYKKAFICLLEIISKYQKKWINTKNVTKIFIFHSADPN